MKLCVIGNSHLAAFRIGLTKAPDLFPDLDVEFFGAKGVGLKALRVRDGRMVARSPKISEQLSMTSGGKTSIDPKAYDAFLIVGLNAGAASLMKCARRHRTVQMVAKSTPSHLVSDAMFDIAARELLEGAVFLQVVDQLRQIVADRPIVVAANPCPSWDIVAAEPDPWADADLVGPRLAAIWEEKKRKVSADLGVEFVEQPDETLKNGFFTREEFAHGSVRLRLTAEHEDGEFNHMNADYGLVYLKRVMARLDELIRASAERTKAAS